MGMQIAAAAKCDKCGEVIQVSREDNLNDGTNHRRRNSTRSQLRNAIDELRIEMLVMGWHSYSNFSNSKLWVNCPRCKDSAKITADTERIKKEASVYASRGLTSLLDM